MILHARNVSVTLFQLSVSYKGSNWGVIWVAGGTTPLLCILDTYSSCCFTRISLLVD